MKKESVLKGRKMLELGLGWGRMFLVGTWFLQKNILVDNLFTASALTKKNIFPAIPRHEYILIFKSSAYFITTMFINY